MIKTFRLAGFCLFLILAAVPSCSDIPLPPDPEGGVIDPKLDNDSDGYTPEQGDCDDTDYKVNPGQTEIPYNQKDDDCNPATKDDDLDGDGFEKLGVGDCDDNDKTVYPGAKEIPYDGIDQDCSGKDLTDVDGDGFDSTEADGNDCDDNDKTINPTAIEICGDGIDQDCSGADQECSDVDSDGDGYTPNQGDCDDTDKYVHPNATEIPYNGKNDDCDVPTETPDDDLDDDGFNKIGGGDCDDTEKSIYPGAKEIPYDGVDQDCSGEDFTDQDFDGFDSVKVAGGTDCDDSNAFIHPDITEIPYDGIDQDCDGDDFYDKGSIVIADGANATAYLKVASSKTHFLVVWRESDSTAATYRILGQRYKYDGTKDGSLIEFSKVSSADKGLYYSTVASDGINFLVAWQEKTLSDSTYRFGFRFVNSTTGTLGATYFHAQQNYSSEEFQLIYGANSYACMWRSLNTIYFASVSANGSSMGTNKTILSSTTSTISYMRAASNGSSYLITWRESSGSYVLRGQIFNLSGVATSGFFDISTVNLSHYYPKTISTGTYYFVTWHDYRLSGNANIYGQRVNSTGSLVGSSASDNLAIALPIDHQRIPSPLYCNSHISVFFQDYQYSGYYVLSMQRLDLAGNPIETDIHDGKLIYADENVYRPDLIESACGGGTSEFVVWKLPNQSIRGKIVK